MRRAARNLVFSKEIPLKVSQAILILSNSNTNTETFSEFLIILIMKNYYAVVTISGL